MNLSSTIFHGQTVLHTSRDELFDVVNGLNEDGFDMVVDLTAVDYGTHPGRDDLPDGILGERFELVVSLINHRRHERIRLRVQIPDSDPTVP